MNYELWVKCFEYLNLVRLEICFNSYIPVSVWIAGYYLFGEFQIDTSCNDKNIFNRVWNFAINVEISVTINIIIEIIIIIFNHFQLL